jgi:Holliday junction resolvase
MSRNKGSSFERKIANELKRWFPNAKRGIGQTRSSSEVPDVDGTPFWIECKHRKSISIVGAFEQATRALARATQQRGIGQIPWEVPLVVSRVDGGPILVTMSAEAFANMLEIVYPPKPPAADDDVPPESVG